MYAYEEWTDTETGITVKVVADEGGDTESPLEYDDAVMMCIYHRHRTNPMQEKFPYPQDAQAFWEEISSPNYTGPWVGFSLFAYEHGNIMFRPSQGSNPFDCPWDSGQIGLIFIKASGVGPDGPYKAAEQVCDTYSSWCNGEVYGFIIEDADGEQLDSCWGYIGDSRYCFEDGKTNAAYYIEQAKKDAETLKQAHIAAYAEEMEASRPDMYT